MPLGTEVGLIPDDIVLDGDPAPFRYGTTASPLFGPCLLWPNGWIDQDATWYGGIGLGQGDIVLHGHLASPTERGRALLTFAAGPCLLWPNGCIDQDAT